MPDTLHVQCANGHWVLTGDHGAPGAALVCDTDRDCCTEAHEHSTECDPNCAVVHDHDAAGHACPGNPAGPAHDPQHHAGQPCPWPPEACPTFGGGYVSPTADPENFSGFMVKGQCPGGHCGVGVPDCTVCRPVKVTALRGAFGTLQPFTPAGS